MLHASVADFCFINHHHTTTSLYAEGAGLPARNVWVRTRASSDSSHPLQSLLDPLAIAPLQE